MVYTAIKRKGGKMPTTFIKFHLLQFFLVVPNVYLAITALISYTPASSLLRGL